jgi:hypothetical protein
VGQDMVERTAIVNKVMNIRSFLFSSTSLHNRYTSFYPHGVSLACNRLYQGHNR